MTTHTRQHRNEHAHYECKGMSHKSHFLPSRDCVSWHVVSALSGTCYKSHFLSTFTDNVPDSDSAHDMRMHMLPKKTKTQGSPPRSNTEPFYSNRKEPFSVTTQFQENHTSVSSKSISQAAVGPKCSKMPMTFLRYSIKTRAVSPQPRCFSSRCSTNAA